jgi:hypothetical protein
VRCFTSAPPSQTRIKGIIEVPGSLEVQPFTFVGDSAKFKIQYQNLRNENLNVEGSFVVNGITNFGPVQVIFPANAVLFGENSHVVGPADITRGYVTLMIILTPQAPYEQVITTVKIPHVPAGALARVSEPGRPGLGPQD